jgi:hypothetical protein
VLKRNIIIVILLLIPAAALAQPQISFDSETSDFGVTTGKTILEHKFVIRNEGTEDLVIRKIEAP